MSPIQFYCLKCCLSIRYYVNYCVKHCAVVTFLKQQPNPPTFFQRPLDKVAGAPERIPGGGQPSLLLLQRRLPGDADQLHGSAQLLAALLQRPHLGVDVPIDLTQCPVRLCVHHLQGKIQNWHCFLDSDTQAFCFFQQVRQLGPYSGVRFFYEVALVASVAAQGAVAANAGVTRVTEQYQPLVRVSRAVARPVELL